ncbi:hypothetical protein [Streptomyces sp. NPDC048473]|uniref:hypothetical protein n=1 Tax=Streptomyces sp. NPDC048473 TaxID=3365556 RepID=UPI003722AD08
MPERYPLVEQRSYGRPLQRGNWLHKRPSRDDDDLPRLAAHQVRVFRAGEDYIEDHGRLGVDDSVVIAASSVTVVDRRAGVPVVVEMRIPSAEAGDFTLRVTFHCTVTDAAAVVRDGVTDVEALLSGYLRSIPGLTEEGSGLPVVESTEVRRRIDARLTAFLDMEPPRVSGLKALPFAVDVLTPEELAAHVREVEETRRAREKDRLQEELEKERARAEHEKRRLLEELRREQALIEEQHRQEQALMEEQHRQQYEKLRDQYERGVSADGQDHELMLEAKRNGFVRNQTVEDLRIIGDDPIAADFNAYRNGDISADTLAARLRAAEERRDERGDALREHEREHLERRSALAREDTRLRLERDDRIRELTRKDRREDATVQRQENAHLRQQEREAEQRRRQEEREDTQVQRQEQREWREQVLQAQHDLRVRAISRGHGDDVPVDVGALINSVGEIPQPGAQAPALGQGGGDDVQVQKVTSERLDREAGGADSDSDSDSDIGDAGMEERRVD